MMERGRGARREGGRGGWMEGDMEKEREEKQTHCQKGGRGKVLEGTGGRDVGGSEKGLSFPGRRLASTTHDKMDASLSWSSVIQVLTSSRRRRYLSDVMQFLYRLRQPPSNAS
ncbi:hypothetical protein E2C01_055403 [Portunus trituberculatus]|uniref:Uncharacterized protein n=1 Tax=Portunus trituberculatus TaxID=210409 RepID=A0A5B7GUM5_PORTR|nr:hypothetical protein [Portunus trituberculatus]